MWPWQRAVPATDPEIGRAYVIIHPSEGSTPPGGSEEKVNLGNKGHTSLLIERGGGQAPIYLSFAPDARGGRIALFTRGTSIARNAQIFRVDGVDTGRMAAYVERLSESVRARRWGWGYDRVRHNCTQVVETALMEGGYRARYRLDPRIATPDILAASLRAQLPRAGVAVPASPHPVSRAAIAELVVIKDRAVLPEQAPARARTPGPFARLVASLRPAVPARVPAVQARPVHRAPPAATGDAMVIEHNPMFRDGLPLSPASHAVEPAVGRAVVRHATEIDLAANERVETGEAKADEERPAHSE